MCACMYVLTDTLELHQIIVIKQFERLQSADCFMQITFANAKAKDMTLRYITKKSRDSFQIR